MIELTTEPIDYNQLTESVRDHAAGAVTLFLGTVREFTRGVQTSWLEYEAYPDMARASMAELEAEAFQKFTVTKIAISHRTGTMALGEISVAIAVSSPHRDQAFEAGRWLIDTLKERVPIWKKEHFADGREEWQHPGMTPQTNTKGAKS
jgi:molybdopterin synthase catalytic subunit